MRGTLRESIYAEVRRRCNGPLREETDMRAHCFFVARAWRKLDFGRRSRRGNAFLLLQSLVELPRQFRTRVDD